MLPGVLVQQPDDGTVAGEGLEIDHISKRYGNIVALRDLSFGVRRGEVFGFVGSNGAGKTTTMRIVMVYWPRMEGRCDGGAALSRLRRAAASATCRRSGAST